MFTGLSFIYFFFVAAKLMVTEFTLPVYHPLDCFL